MIPRAAAELARELRAVKRRTRSGLRFPPWFQIADELARQGHGRFDPYELGRAAENLAADTHPLAPMREQWRQALNTEWERQWARDFPDEPWPGIEAARRRVREKVW